MHIVVVGAGISGLSSAWALAKRGHQVTLIEQGPLPNPLAASGDHHRIIRRAYGAATGYANTITEAYDAWDELWDDLGRSHLDPRGFLCVSREQGDEAETYLEGMKAGGYPVDIFDGAEAARRYPFLEAQSVRFGFSSTDGGALHCKLIASDMAGWLRGNGVRLLTETRAAAVDPAAAVVRLDTGEEIAADRIVVTAGAWVARLFPELTNDLTTYRTAVVYLDPPHDLKSAWEAAPVIVDVGGKTDGYILPPSGTGGLKFGSGLHKEKWPDADAGRTPRAGEGEQVRDLFAPPMKRLDEYRVLNVVTCAYTFTPDETFYCRPADKALIVSACSGHGYKFGAAVGRRIAGAVESGDNDSLARWLRAEAA